MAISLEEKAKLLQEVGMKNAANKILMQLEAQAQIKKLTDMKFRVTTKQEIEKKICGWYFKWRWEANEVSLTAFLSVVTIVTGLLVFIVSDGIHHPTPFLRAVQWTIGAAAAATALWTALTCPQKSVLREMPLADWEDGIPTGALLAIKEAKEKGLSYFEIYYPVTRQREQWERIKADPVIVGYRDSAQNRLSVWWSDELQKRTVGVGPMIEIFAWDDGKVYE